MNNVEKLKNKIIELEYKTFTQQDIINVFLNSNKRLFNVSFNKLIQKEDKSRLSFHTVLLDLEYLFLFQKLFEMHVFDYIVDRQNPDNKTEQDTKELIKECKNYTTKLLQSFCCNDKLNILQFKESFYNFVKQFKEKYY